MKLRSFLAAASAFILVTGILYLIGNIFDISWLMFRHEYRSDDGEFYIYIGSLMPAVIGLAASYIAEKIYVSKHRKKLG